MLELAAALLATGVLLGAIALLGRGIATVLDGQSSGQGANYPGAVIAWWFLGLGGFFGVLLIHLLFDAASPLLDAAVGGTAPGIAVLALTLAFVYVTAALVPLAASRGLRPVRRAAVTYAVDPAHRRRKWQLLTTGWGLLPVILLVLVLGDGFGLLAVVGLLGFVALFAVLHAIWAFPLRPVDATIARDPDDAERQRLRDCCEALGIEPSQVIVYASSGPNAVKVLGHGSRRRCWITEEFLADAADEDLRVALSQATTKADRYFWERYRLGTILLVGAIWIAVVGSFAGIPIEPAALAVLVGAVLLALAVLWTARRTTARADRTAREAFGEAAVVGAYERHGETIQDTAPPAWGFHVFQPDPGIELRLERLE